MKEFKSGTLTLGIDDLGGEAAAALTGASVDSNGVLISASEDGSPVAIGFRAHARSTGSISISGCTGSSLPSQPKHGTKADSITFSTPSIEGTILRRNKPDAKGRHPWKSKC